MDRQNPEELISAYLDGELDAEDRARAERLLASDENLSQLLEEWRELRSTIKALPQHQLEEDFGQQVLQRAERAMLSGSDGSPHAAAAPPVAASATSGPARWLRPAIWAGLTIAAAILVMVMTQDPTGDNVVQKPEVAAAGKPGEVADTPSESAKSQASAPRAPEEELAKFGNRAEGKPEESDPFGDGAEKAIPEVAAAGPAPAADPVRRNGMPAAESFAADDPIAAEAPAGRQASNEEIKSAMRRKMKAAPAPPAKDDARDSAAADAAPADGTPAPSALAPRKPLKTELAGRDEKSASPRKDNRGAPSARPQQKDGAQPALAWNERPTKEQYARDVKLGKSAEVSEGAVVLECSFATSEVDAELKRLVGSNLVQSDQFASLAQLKARRALPRAKQQSVETRDAGAAFAQQTLKSPVDRTAKIYVAVGTRSEYETLMKKLRSKPGDYRCVSAVTSLATDGNAVVADVAPAQSAAQAKPAAPARIQPEAKGAAANAAKKAAKIRPQVAAPTGRAVAPKTQAPLAPEADADNFEATDAIKLADDASAVKGKPTDKVKRRHAAPVHQVVLVFQIVDAPSAATASQAPKAAAEAVEAEAIKEE